MDYRYSSTNDRAQDPEPQYRSIQGLTRVLVTLLAASAVVAVLGIVSSLMQLDLLSRSYTSVEATANDARQQLIASSSAVLILVTFVLFAIWIVRAHRNLPGLGGERLDVSPGWALGWFFVPIANLWKPYKAMRTLWKASHDGPRWDLEEVPWWFTMWWVVWLIAGALSRVADGLSRSETIPGLISMTEAQIASEASLGLLDCLALMIVLRIARAQSKQFAARASIAASVAAGSPPPETDLRGWRVRDPV
jgi:hypothetical protein